MDKRIDLIRWAERQIGKQFKWGKIDCTTLTLEAIRIYYGISIPIAVEWKSLKTALRAYQKNGNPPDILQQNGFVEIKKNYEQTGDIFVWRGNGYWLLGIIINGAVLVADEGKKVEMRPIQAFPGEYQAWRRLEAGV
ncbi:MAG: hypothetical protein HRF42_11035 [Candidatus Brocadia sp.]|jgi:hypothetical protein